LYLLRAGLLHSSSLGDSSNRARACDILHPMQAHSRSLLKICGLLAGTRLGGPPGGAPSWLRMPGLLKGLSFGIYYAYP